MIFSVLKIRWDTTFLKCVITNMARICYSPNLITDMRYEVVMAMKMSLLVFCVATSCGHVGSYHHFREHNASIFRAEVVYFSETLVSTYKSTLCYNQE
jgi:hypothetical protein